MGTPSWLYYLFGLVMFGVAAYCLVLLVLSVTGRHHSGRDVDIAHIFMGTSMAGMFVTKWAFGPSALWELVFAALMIWFIVRSLQSIQRFGLHKPHEAIHATMSFAMLLMYWFPVGSTSGVTGMSMSMSSGAAKLDPGLGFVLAVIFFGSAIFTLASPVKGASHHGTHAFAYATIAAEQDKGSRGSSGNGTPALEALFTTPWLEDASHVAMCVAMGFMLILML
ncbi:MAG: DUF5134 domain-containing protein [Acidimicrobiales bacterium]